jgi:hypothetical protein
MFPKEGASQTLETGRAECVLINGQSQSKPDSSQWSCETFAQELLEYEKLQGKLNYCTSV